MVRRGSTVRVRDRAPVFSPAPCCPPARLPIGSSHARYARFASCRQQHVPQRRPPRLRGLRARPGRGAARAGRRRGRGLPLGRRRRPWRYASAAALARAPHRRRRRHAHYGLSGFVALAAPRRSRWCSPCTAATAIIRWSAPRPARRAGRRVIAVSDELAGLSALPRRRTSAGVDLELFGRMPRAEARARLGLDPARCSLPRRPGAPREALLARARRLRRRRAGGTAGRRRVPLWINAADAVLVPSAREGYGLACVEALACDVPVLSTPVGVAPRLLSGVEGTLRARRSRSSRGERGRRGDPGSGRPQMRDARWPRRKASRPARVTCWCYRRLRAARP